MAGSFSDYAEDKILELLVGKTAFATPTVWVALSTADPTDDGSGIAEPSGDAYGRVDSTGLWGTASGGSLANSGAITFPAATPGAWGAITHFALFDDETAGNMLAHGELTTPKTVGIGDVASFGVGALTITLT